MLLKSDNTFDVIIVGGGPAGTTTAMALENSGLRVALIDKCIFPRDKICGDFVAIGGLKETFTIKPELKERFEKYPKKAINRKTHFYIDDYKPIEIEWVTTSYTIKRIDFDNELMEVVKESGKTHIYEGDGIKEIEEVENEYRLTTKQGIVFNTSVLIGADGAHSIVAKKLADYKLDKNHYGGSVRAYYQKLRNVDSAITELYIHKDVVSGYFWLFPLSNTEANVGLGMHSRYITKNKVNLKELMLEFIGKHKILKSKFSTAEIDGKIEGFGLPLYSKKYKLSGKRFMLLGDAGNLIDPSNGEGIMPAICSAKYAAETIKEAFKKNDFSESQFKKYDDRVHAKFWREMRFKAFFMKYFVTQYQILKSIGYLSQRSTLVKKVIKSYM